MALKKTIVIDDHFFSVTKSAFMNRYYDEDRIYRFPDELCWRSDRCQKENGNDVKHDVERITYTRTPKVLGGKVAVIFYDTTTMYFGPERMTSDVPSPVQQDRGAHLPLLRSLHDNAGARTHPKGCQAENRTRS